MEEKPGINVTPLVDMMFILIIFFLATTQFQQEERDLEVNLPETHVGEALSEAARTLLVINVRRDGSYVLRDQVFSPDQLRETIAVTVSQNPGQKVLVRADKQALHGYVAAAVSLCYQAGIRRANIGYELPR